MPTRSVSTPNYNQTLLTVSLKEHPSIKSLTEYFLSKANPNPAFCAVLEDALASSSNNHVGLILSERLVNMPVQVVPPMYRLLADEIKWAIEEVCISLGQILR
jgi:protein BCP1